MKRLLRTCRAPGGDRLDGDHELTPCCYAAIRSGKSEAERIVPMFTFGRTVLVRLAVAQLCAGNFH